MRTMSMAALAVVTLALAACDRPQGKSDAETDDEETVAAIPVEIARAERGDIYATYASTAPIEAFAEATVIAKVRGEVRDILAEEGDAVVAGQVLARLDGDRLRLQLQQSEANLQKLRRDYKRNLDLKTRGLISEGDFEKIQYEMEALQASNNLAELELSYTEIRAPIDGVISERYVKKGNTIDVGAQVFHITSLEPLVVYLHVPEREYRRIAQGMKATLDVDALAGQQFAATIARIGPVVDPQTGTFKITVEVSDPSQRLKPGMFARIAIVSDVRPNALQIPRAAIVDDDNQQSVFVVEDDVAKRRNVSTGLAANGFIEVIDGLNGDERIIVVGHTGLRDGATVDVINDAPRDKKALASAPPETASDAN